MVGYARKSPPRLQHARVLAQQQIADVRQEDAARRVRVSHRVREKVVRADVALLVNSRVLIRHAVRQQQQHAQRSRRLVRPVRPQPARAHRDAEPAHCVHEEPVCVRGCALRIPAGRHVHRPVNAQRVQRAHFHQHRPPHPLHQRRAPAFTSPLSLQPAASACVATAAVALPSAQKAHARESRPRRAQQPGTRARTTRSPLRTRRAGARAQGPPLTYQPLMARARGR